MCELTGVQKTEELGTKNGHVWSNGFAEFIFPPTAYLFPVIFPSGTRALTLSHPLLMDQWGRMQNLFRCSQESFIVQHRRRKIENTGPLKWLLHCWSFHGVCRSTDSSSPSVQHLSVHFCFFWRLRRVLSELIWIFGVDVPICQSTVMGLITFFLLS